MEVMRDVRIHGTYFRKFIGISHPFIVLGSKTVSMWTCKSDDGGDIGPIVYDDRC